MSDDDIDNMDFDLPAELVAPPPTAGTPSFANIGQPHMGFMTAPETVFDPTTDYTNPSFSSTYPSSDDSWVCVYPVNISTKPMKKGRRIALEHAIESPVALYMAESAKRLGLQVHLESNKRHPKDAFTFGRLRVKLKNEVGVCEVGYISNKRVLMEEIAKGYKLVEEEMGAGDVKVFCDASLSIIPESTWAGVDDQPAEPEPKVPAITESVPVSAASSPAPSKKSNKKKKGRK